VRLSNSFASYESSLSTATRQGLRRARRRLFEGNRARVQVISEPDDVPLLIEWMNNVYASSWQAKTFGETHVKHPAERRLLTQIAGQGWLRSYILLKDKQPIAYQHGYLYRDMYYRLDCAFNQSYSSEGPGSVLMHCLLEDLHDTKAATIVDFGFGDLRYKRSLGNFEQNAAVVYFVPPNRWRYLLGVQTVLNWAYDVIRRGLICAGADAIVRKLVKRQK
jgi:CelD/BcsL family acetyltransferase involved in cellulose biosynthesis